MSEIRIWATHVSSSLLTYCRSTPGSLDLSRLGKGGIGVGGAEEEGRGAAGISPPLKDDIEEEEVLEEEDNLTSLSLRKAGNPEFEDGSEKAEEDEKNVDDDVEPAQDLSKSGDRSAASPVAEEEEEAKGE